MNIIQAKNKDFKNLEHAKTPEFNSRIVRSVSHKNLDSEGVNEQDEI
jgi:hypothetical protein